MTKRIVSLIMLLVLVLAPYAYAKSKAVTGVKLSPKNMILDVGISDEFEVTFKPASANSALRWKSSRPDVAIVDDDGVITAIAPGRTTIACQTKNGKTAKATVTVPDPGKVIALTFDDGPTQNTRTILKVLSDNDVKATFFMLGDLVDRNPEIAAEVANAGHEVASHSIDHKNLQKMSLADAQEQVERSFNSIETATGIRPTVMRAPYGAIDKKLAEALDTTFIQWTVDPEDWKYRDGKQVYNNVFKHVKADSIILLHDIHATTTDAVKLIVPELKRQGYKFLTVSELIEHRGLTETNGTIVF